MIVFYPHPAVSPADDRSTAARLPLASWVTLYLLFGLLLPSQLRAVPATTGVARLSTAEGLSHSTVWDIHQDRRGFLWLATEDGLNRYDGGTFRVFRHAPEDPHSLSDSETLDIFEDREGHLWLTTRNRGVNRFDPVRETFTRIRHDAENPQSLCHDTTYGTFEDRVGTIWIRTAGGLSRHDPASGETRCYRHDPEVPSSLGGLRVHAIGEDAAGQLWIGTSSGLDRFSAATGTFDPIALPSAGQEASQRINQILESRDRQLWIVGEHDLFRMNAARTDIERLEVEPVGIGSVPVGLISRLHEAADGSLWSFSRGGYLSRIDTDGTFQHIPVTPGSEIFGGQEDEQGDLWLGTEVGVFRFDHQRETLVHYRNRSGDRHSLSADLVMALRVDRSGIVWIGTYQGANKIDRRQEQFTTYRAGFPGLEKLEGSGVWPILEDRDGALWFGTYEHGLVRFDRDTGKADIYRQGAESAPDLSSDRITALLQDRNGRLWIGTADGLNRLSADRQHLEHFLHDPQDPHSLGGWSVFALREDRSGRIWIGTENGVDRFEDGRFVHDEPTPGETSGLPHGAIYTLVQDRSGTLWAASPEAPGLARLDPETNRFRRLQQASSPPNAIDQQLIGCLHEDGQGQLWVGTYNAGLALLDAERREIRRYRQADGLPSDTVLGILEDETGSLWLSTFKGLSRFDPRTETFRNYDAADGLQDNVFASASSYRSDRGEMFFGGPGGLTAFFPQRITDDPVVPEVVLTDFKLFYESVAPVSGDAGGRSPLTQSITDTAAITLNHRQYLFAFEFAGLHFADPARNRYAYRLEGFDEQWIETDAGRRVAQYANLRPGTYTFQVKAANKDGVWNEQPATIAVRILPAPWRTWWAYALYLSAFLGLVAAVLRWQHKKVVRERAINERLREVDRLRGEFLANTSHELRTPLYGIIGLAESLLDGAAGKLGETATANLGMIASSGRRLSSLVNDILDFSKLSHKTIALQQRPVDLHALTDAVLALLRPLLGGKSLELIHTVAADLPPVFADEDRLQQILYNLIGNAVKFTAAGTVEVAAVQADDLIKISVRDTGIGIPEDKQALIFEQFQQADASTERQFGGTGLGLAVTRELVALHGGSIWVESHPGKGSTFFFTLPVARASASADDARDPQTTQSELRSLASIVAADDPRPTASPPAPGRADATVLVIDDEPVIRQVLQSYLSIEGYEVLQASSGEEGLQRLRTQSVDLVLLDVMMPKLSGYDVCRQLREAYLLEELPVVFLTAKNQLADLEAGFAAGGNDYLTKPISKGELLSRVGTHLRLLRVHRSQKEDVKVLSGLLPICADCKKVRDDGGYWSQLEEYIDSHSEATFSHGLCPDCFQRTMRQIPGPLTPVETEP